MISRYQTLLLVAATFLGALDASIVGPALNTFRAEWGLSDRSLSWVFGAFYFCYLAGAPLLASISDLKGRKGVLLLAMGLFTAGSGIIAAAGSFPWVLAGRALQGLGVAGIMPTVLAYIGDGLPREKQGMALGMIGSGMGVAFILGPVLGGILIRYSWRALFLINIPLGIAYLALARKGLRDIRKEGAAAFDVPGLALMSVAFGLLAWGINRLEADDFPGSLISWRCLPFLAAALLLLPVFYRLEMASPSPALDPRVLRSRNMVLVNLLSVGAGVCMVSVFFLPRAAAEAFHVGAAAASLRILPAVLAFVAGSAACGALLGKFPTKAILLAGLGLVALGMVVIASLGNEPVWFYSGTMALGAGLAGTTGPPLRYIVNAEAAEADRGTCQALLLSCQTIGQLVGSVGIGALSDAGGTAAWPFATAYSALAALAAALFLLSLGLVPESVPDRDRSAAETGAAAIMEANS